MSVPTILEVAEEIHRATGKKPLSPRWEAVARLTYKLPLRDDDVDHLAASTRRSKAQLRAMARELGVGRRRFNEIWARVGRRGRKSFTMALIAVYEACFAGHERYLVAGERGLIAIISKDTAGSTIVANFCELHANALGFQTNWTNIGAIRVLQIAGVPFGIACFPCNAKAPRGFAIPVLILDEPAHWATALEFETSDERVISAAKPAMAQFPDALLLAISSPLGKVGVFHETVEANLGEDAAPGVLAVEGPTWVWNPEIPEARTHELERDPVIHSCEYGARPKDAASSVLTAELIATAQRPVPRGGHWGRSLRAIDQTSGRGDSYVDVGVAWRYPTVGDPCDYTVPLLDEHGNVVEGLFQIDPKSGAVVRDANGVALLRDDVDQEALRPALVFFDMHAVEGAFYGVIRLEQIIADISDRARRDGSTHVVGDSREELGTEALFRANGLTFTPIAWTNELKSEAVLRLRRLMVERSIILPRDEGLKNELLNFQEKILPSGSVTYGGRGRVRDDRVAAILTALMAEQRGLLASPLTIGKRGRSPQTGFADGY